jgi:hypothetical protein
MPAIILSQVEWCSYFRTSLGSHILLKSALKSGDKIGAYNPFGQLIWIDANATVYPVITSA